MRCAPEYHALAVAAAVEETADACSFVLDVPPALKERFAYAAGQFCTFRATIGGETVSRCYSMSSSPDADDSFAVTVKRVPGGKMSGWMIDRLGPGDTIEATPPLGRFVLRPSEAPVFAFAGGSGITPVLSIIKSALATTPREIQLVYANRGPDSVIFEAVLERLVAESAGRLSVHHHLDSEKGYLDADACAALLGARTHADFYVCGPAPFMEVVEEGLEQRGVDPGQLFVERFEVFPGETFAETEASATESIEIRLRGRTHHARYERGDTILDAARRAALKPPFSCTAGSCGTCMAFVANGEVAMRVNNVLDPDEVEQGWVLTCQAIPRSREVAIDYDR